MTGDHERVPDDHDGRRRAILSIDTATRRIVIATGSPSGVTDGISTWPAGYRHGETLLRSIGRFLGEQNIRRSRLVGIVVGSGPGAFTGLRVGIATAKGMARSQARSQAARSMRPARKSASRSSSHAGRGRLPMTVVGKSGNESR